MEKITRPTNVDLIIYHDPCYDGMAAFWTLSQLYPKAVGLPTPINKIPLEKSVYEGKHIIMVDVVTCDHDEIAAAAASLLILDHHKTSRDALAGLSYAYFDMNRSGVGLAWQLAFQDMPMPKFIQYLEERDLFKFSCAESKHFNMGLHDYFASFTNGSTSEKLLTLSILHQEETPELFNEICVLGSRAETRIRERNESITATAKMYDVVCPNLSSIRAVIVECLHSEISDLGNHMITNVCDIDLVIGWRFDEVSKEYWYSVRSDDKHEDASVFCKMFGGGGHRNASGFAAKLPPMELFACTEIGPCVLLK